MIAFVAAVGDVWQHQSLPIDKQHADRGMGSVANPLFAGHFDPTPKTQSIEIPKAIEAYQILADAEMPFGVAPGNHDYDAMWNSDQFPPNTKKPREELGLSVEDIGMLHVGGLDNFRSAFGDDKPFFKGKPWYVASFRGGANSAQVFTAGGYEFLHFALEMHAGDEVVAWVESVMAKYPGRPTILSTHDYLDTAGQRHPNPIIDLDRVDPDEHNSAEELFAELIAKNDQIFLVLCGHQHGQSFRVDPEREGQRGLSDARRLSGPRSGGTRLGPAPRSLPARADGDRRRLAPDAAVRDRRHRAADRRADVFDALPRALERARALCRPGTGPTSSRR